MKLLFLKTLRRRLTQSPEGVGIEGNGVVNSTSCLASGGRGSHD